MTLAKNTEFGRRVKQLRETRLGASRARLACLLQISEPRLEMIEFGQIDRSDITEAELTRFAETLHCSREWLVHGRDLLPQEFLPVGSIALRSGGGPVQREIAFAEDECPNCQHKACGSRCDTCGHPLE